MYLVAGALCLAIPITQDKRSLHSPKGWRRGDQNIEQTFGSEDVPSQVFWPHNHCYSSPQSYPKHMMTVST